MTWYWISLPYATYGIAAQNGRIVDAAPIAQWMIGKDENFCLGWAFKKGADIRELV